MTPPLLDAMSCARNAFPCRLGDGFGVWLLLNMGRALGLLNRGFEVGAAPVREEEEEKEKEEEESLRVILKVFLQSSTKTSSF